MEGVRDRPVSTRGAWIARATLVVLVVTGCASFELAPHGTPPPGTGGPDPVATSTARPASSPLPSADAPVTSPPAPTEGTTPGPRRTPDAASEPLPDCRYTDVPVLGDPVTGWATVVLDTIYQLPSDYAPATLVSTSRAGIDGGFQVSKVVINDLRALHDASVAAGAEVAVRSAYRSYAEQQGTFAHWVDVAGRDGALAVSARPGHSEHQLGTAIDFRSASSTKAPWDYADWGATKPGAWMADHAWEHGFVLSYPKGMKDETCYESEPWHYRYVGRELAAAVHDSGLTLRRYLWEHLPGR